MKVFILRSGVIWDVGRHYFPSCESCKPSQDTRRYTGHCIISGVGIGRKRIILIDVLIILMVESAAFGLHWSALKNMFYVAYEPEFQPFKVKSIFWLYHWGIIQEAGDLETLIPYWKTVSAVVFTQVLFVLTNLKVIIITNHLSMTVFS